MWRKYICPGLLEGNHDFKETVTFKLYIWDFRVILTDFEWYNELIFK